MTLTLDQPNLLVEVGKLQDRVYGLEHGRGGVQYDANGAPIYKRGITIGNSTPIYVDEDVPIPTGLSLAWGSFFENIFVSASWTAPTGTGSSQVNQYEAELTEVGVGVVASLTVGGTSARFNGVKPNVEYSVRVRSINRISQTSAYTAAQTITTGADATVPGQVTGVIAGAGQKTITIRWTENTEQDVKNGHGGYEVMIATDAAFTLNVRTVRTTGTITSFGDLTTGTQYHLKVRAFDSSGNFGAFSVTVTATPSQATGPDIASGEVCDDHVCASGVSASKITFGEMDGDRITVNTLNANRIETSELNAQTITIAGSGMLRIGRTTSPFHYMLQDASGIRLYTNGSAAFTGGTLKVDINVTTGSIAITDGALTAPTIVGGTITGGTIRTAASGRRVQLDSTNYSDVSFYTGDAAETQRGIISVLVSGAGATRQGTLETRSPDMGTGYAVIAFNSTSVDGTLKSQINAQAGEHLARLSAATNSRWAVINSSGTTAVLDVRDSYVKGGQKFYADFNQAANWDTKGFISRDATPTPVRAGYAAEVGTTQIQWEVTSSARWRAVTADSSGFVPVEASAYWVNGFKVIGPRGAAITAPDGTLADANRAINDLRNTLITHGLTS